FENLGHFIAECCRVLRAGGRLSLLEVAEPGPRVLKLGHSMYFGRVVPLVGGLVSDRAAYQYLPKSVAYLPSVPEMMGLLVDNGLPDARRVSLSMGIAQLLTGTRRR